MDIYQLRSWIFELYDPLERQRQYVIFDAERGNLLVDVPPYSERALRLLRGAGRASLLLVTGAAGAKDAHRYREALGLQVAAHPADAAGIEGGADVLLKDDDLLRPDTLTLRVGDTTVALVRKAGGVLVSGALDLVSPAAHALLSLEFSAILSVSEAPVWNAGKDELLRLQRELPKPKKRFGVLLQAPWDHGYRGRLDDQMKPNPLIPTDRTAAHEAAMGPATLVVARASRDLVESPARPEWKGSALTPPPAAPVAPARRPHNFQEDWSAPATPRPPTTIANPPASIQPVTGIHRPTPLGPRFRELPLELLAGTPVAGDDIGGIDLSPDGAEVAFSWDQPGAPEIFVAPLAGNRLFQLTSSGERSIAPRWSPDGRQLAFLRDGGGFGRRLLWLVDRDGTAERRLCAEGEAHSHGDVSWSPHGSRILCTTIPDAGHSVITTVDAASGTVRSLTDGTYADFEPSWSPDGRMIVFTRRDGRRRHHLMAADGGAAAPLDTGGDAMSARWSPDGSRIAFVIVDGARTHVAMARLVGGRLAGVTRFGETPFDEYEPRWRPDGRGLVYLHQDRASVSAHRIFVSSRTSTPVADRPGVHRDVRVGPDSEMLVYVHSSSTSARDLWMRPARSIAPRRITASLSPLIDPASLVTPVHVTYDVASIAGAAASSVASAGRASPATGGPQKVDALLFIPPAEAVRRPGRPAAVIDVSSVAPAGALDVFRPLAQVLANQGYVVLVPNAATAADVVAGAEWLARTGVADGSRIGAFGGSRALAALASASPQFAAGVLAPEPADGMLEKDAAAVSLPILVVSGANDFREKRIDNVRRSVDWFDRHLLR